MNTKEIERFLEADTVCRIVFQGVFSADTLPPPPRLLVCNTDESTKPGQHWIAIHVDIGGRGEHFDSFGQRPNEHFEAYMNKHCRIWTFIQKQLFFMLRCRRMDMTRMVNMFTTDTAFNDYRS